MKCTAKLCLWRSQLDGNQIWNEKKNKESVVLLSLCLFRDWFMFLLLDLVQQAIYGYPNR